MDINSILAEEHKQIQSRKKQARSTITLCLLACTLLQVAQIVLSMFYVQTGNEAWYLIQNIIIYSLSFIIPFGVFHLLFNFVNKNRPKETRPKRYLPRKPFLYISGTLGIGYIVLLSANLIFGDLVEKLTISDPFVPQTTLGIILFYLYQAFFPAIIEEWAFRGTILKNLLPYGKKGAIVLSALMFGIVHVQPIQACFATVLGLLLGILYEYTNSLFLPIVIHFLNNAIAASSTIFENNALFQTLLSILIFTFIGCAIAFISIYSKRWINTKPASLIKSNIGGYKLSVGEFLRYFFLNSGIIPFAIILMLILYLYYFF